MAGTVKITDLPIESLSPDATVCVVQKGGDGLYHIVRVLVEQIGTGNQSGDIGEFVIKAETAATRAETAQKEAARQADRAAALVQGVKDVSNQVAAVQQVAQQVGQDKADVQRMAVEVSGQTTAAQTHAQTAGQAAIKTGQDRQAVAEAMAGLPAVVKQATDAATQTAADAVQTGKDKTAAEAARRGAEEAAAGVQDVSQQVQQVQTLASQVDSNAQAETAKTSAEQSAAQVGQTVEDKLTELEQSGRFQGKDGKTPHFDTVTATALPAGAQPTAQISGAIEHLTLELGIPQGQPGEGGGGGQNEIVTQNYTVEEAVASYHIPIDLNQQIMVGIAAKFKNTMKLVAVQNGLGSQWIDFSKAGAMDGKVMIPVSELLFIMHGNSVYAESFRYHGHGADGLKFVGDLQPGDTIQIKSIRQTK